MNYHFILAIDPSGAYYEGKGTTGWCLLDAPSCSIISTGSLKALNYTKAETYWDAHLKLIENYHLLYRTNLIIVIEDYVLYGDKAKDQINSHMETCKVIGILQWYCSTHNIPYQMQLAVQVKKRWADEILEHKQYIIKKGKGHALTITNESIDRHEKDAIRHAVHFANFKNKERYYGPK